MTYKYDFKVGSIDPMSNCDNERLIAINFDRVKYWMSKGAGLSPEVGKLLGFYVISFKFISL